MKTLNFIILINYVKIYKFFISYKIINKIILKKKCSNLIVFVQIKIINIIIKITTTKKSEHTDLSKRIAILPII